jgi:xanthosine utilization system XapX-like protein
MARSWVRDHHRFIPPQPAERNESRAMPMHDAQLSWQLAETGTARTVARIPDRPSWPSALRALRAPVWPVVLAVLGALGLLLAFQLVVSRSVAHAERTQAASAARAKSTWRCNLVRNVDARVSCLSQAAGVRDATLP